MPVLLLLFSILLHAQDDYSAEKYCFSGESEALQIESKFAGLKVPSDHVARDKECLVIQMRPHRRELIQRFMVSASPNTKVSFSSEEVRRDPCRLKVEKEKIQDSKTTQVGLDGVVVANTTTKTASAIDTTYIETLKEFAFTYEQDEIKGNCRPITPLRYEISLEVRKNPKPLVPENLPPGSIVVMNRGPIDQETMVLRTQLQIEQGNRIEIGEIVRTLKDKDQSANINPSLKIETSQKIVTEKVFLSLQ